MTLHSVSLLLSVSLSLLCLSHTLLQLSLFPSSLFLSSSASASRQVPFIFLSHSLSFYLVFSLCLHFIPPPCPHCSPSLSNAVTTSPAVPPRLFIANRGWCCCWCWEVGHLRPCCRSHIHPHFSWHLGAQTSILRYPSCWKHTHTTSKHKSASMWLTCLSDMT